MDGMQSAEKPMTVLSFLFDRRFLPAASGHFIVDLLNGQRGVIFTYLSLALGMSNSVLGLISSIYVLVGAVSQPLFGWLSDRIGHRVMVIAGVLWMIVFYALGLMVPGAAAIVLLILASLGSGAFHASGAAQATLAGKSLLTGRAVTAASLFFVFGQLGYSGGPVLAGGLIDRVGLPGILVVCLALLVLTVFLAVYFRPLEDGQIRAQAAADRERANGRRWSFAVLALILIAAFHSWAQANINTFLPKYLSDLGESAVVYGLLPALFFAGGAVGNVLGGNLADRFGGARVVMAGLLGGTLPLLAIPFVGVNGWLVVVTMLAGLLTGSAYSILVVLAQELIPVGMGLSSGLVLSFLFASGAVGTLISGWIADTGGFLPVFLLSAALALAGGLLALGLRRD